MQLKRQKTKEQSQDHRCPLTCQDKTPLLDKEAYIYETLVYNVLGGKCDIAPSLTRTDKLCVLSHLQSSGDEQTMETDLYTTCYCSLNSHCGYGGR